MPEPTTREQFAHGLRCGVCIYATGVVALFLFVGLAELTALLGRWL